MNEIAILSGKGGTGKSSISAAFATIGEDVVIADCDVDAANLHIVLQPQNYHEERFISGFKAFIDSSLCTNCGLCTKHCCFEAISVKSKKVIISATACEGCALCVKICPSSAIRMIDNDESSWFIGFFRNGRMVHASLKPGEDNSGKLVSIVREQARLTAKETGWNNIIIDGPPGIGCSAIASITGASIALLISEPTKSGLHDLERIYDLTKQFKVNAYVIINKYDLNVSMTEKIVAWCKKNKIVVVGKLAFDKNMVDAMMHCKSISEWKPESETSVNLLKIWNEINQNEK